MKGENCRLRDVPRGRRLEHFLAYYKWKMLLFVIFGTSAAYIAYGMLQPYPEIRVLWLSETYSLQAEFDIRDWMEGLDWDLNNDNKITHTLTYIDFDRPYGELSYDTKSEITILVAGQEYSFFLVNGMAMEWMEDNGILGTWGDIGIAGVLEKEYLVVPFSRLAGYSSQEKGVFGEVFLCVTPKPGEGGRLAEYEKQSQALRMLLAASCLLE